MKSVGIITFQWYDNYGTALQAYALQTTLCKLGYDARIVPIEFNSTPGLKRFVAKSRVGVCEKWNKIFTEHGNKRHKQFAAFRKRYFRYVNMAHGTFEQMLAQTVPCDVLVFGSDNIWSPWCVHHDDDMSKLFLGDGINHPYKIVYAASTGGRIARHPRFRESLQRIKRAGFKAISLRESANLQTFADAGFDVVQVPDPSLLLTAEAWRKMAWPQDDAGCPYVMGYDLGHKGAFDIRSACEHLARHEGWQVRIPYPKRWWHDRLVACCPGPQEWLTLIKNAECLVTNSFHGVMFALVFNCPFVFLEIFGNEEAVELNMRAKEILSRVGLEHRIVPSSCQDISLVSQIFRTPIDWQEVNLRLDEFRNVGINYLKTVIK